MNYKEILGEAITQMERLVSEARAAVPAQGSDAHVVVKGRSIDGQNFFVLGTLYADQIPPTGELDGFRVQRMMNLGGVYHFSERSAQETATKMGAQALPFVFWLNQEISALERHLTSFRKMEARFDAAIR